MGTLRIVIVTLGYILTGTLLYYSHGLWGFPAFVTGLAATEFGLFLVRSSARKRYVESEAAKWIAERSKQNPKRETWRIFSRCLLWLPSGCALLTLCFFPISTHIMIHPGKHYLPHYNIPIPWAWTVIPGGVTVENPNPFPPDKSWWVDVVISSKGLDRFGVTPIGRNEPYSGATFGTADDLSRKALDRERESRLQGANQVSSMEIQLGTTPLTCWRYIPQNKTQGRWMFNLPLSENVWAVDCETPTRLGDHAFYASFFGREEDLRAFYTVLRKITPV
jgi:hypothetical protein